MTRKPGPTGDFPQGKLRPDDKGGLDVAITTQGNMMFFDFATPVTWLAIPKEQAIEFAKLILRRAGAKKVEIHL